MMSLFLCIPYCMHTIYGMVSTCPSKYSLVIVHQHQRKVTEEKSTSTCSEMFPDLKCSFNV